MFAQLVPNIEANLSQFIGAPSTLSKPGYGFNNFPSLSYKSAKSLLCSASQSDSVLGEVTVVYVFSVVLLNSESNALPSLGVCPSAKG